MSNENKDSSAQDIPDKPGGSTDLSRGIVRFAQYTSPIMLVMLASAGKDMALAQCSPRCA